MGLLSAMTIITKTKAPERLIGKHVQNSIFSEISSLTSKKSFLAHSLCHVIYVTYFNKCSDPDVKFANV